MAAPSPSPSQRRPIPADRPGLWVNPCGFYTQSEEHDLPPPSPPQVTALADDRQILNTVIISADHARKSVDGFKNKYVKDTFGDDFENHHNLWKNIGYDWLLRNDQVPKSLGVKTHHNHLQTIELDGFLKDSYRYMQIMAVAIEQVAWDQGQHDSLFVDQFRDVEFRLRAVLCEIQMAMYERKIDPHPDVTRDVMSDDLRNIKDDGHRHLRDWIIFRDYMIVLEYIMDVLNYFCDNPTRITPS